MKEQMATYFLAEKHESLFFVLAGLGALALTAWLFRGPYRGMGVPLVLVGLIQIGVGASVYLRSDDDLATRTAQLDSEPARLRLEEVPRMEKVMSNFRIYKLVELLVLACGIALTFAFPHRDFLYAMGIGCIAQGSLMLVLDLFAEHRGAAYLAALRSLGA